MKAPEAHRSPRRLAEPFAASFGLVLLGQALLLALGPLTRAARAQEGSSGPFGIALQSSDSLYYLKAAAEGPYTQVPISRLAYPALLQLGIRIGAVEMFAVSLNLIALILAGGLLYDLGRRYGKGRLAGVASASAFVLNPLTAQWMRFILTETLIYSCVIAILWTSERHARNSSRPVLWVSLGVGVFASLLRPNGVLLLGSAVSIVALNGLNSRRHRGLAVASVAGLWLVVLSSVPLLSQSHISDGRDEAAPVVVQLLYDGVVIEGSPHARVLMPMPPAPEPIDASISAALRYALNEPLAVALLGLRRIAYETVQVRRHYPLVVNIVVGAAIVAYLALAAIGSMRGRSLRLNICIASIALPQMALIGATFAVPESRYGWTYLVTLAVWVGVGLERLLSSRPWSR